MFRARGPCDNWEMPEPIRLRIAIVDDLEINQRGTASLLADVDGVEVSATFDFPQALEFAGWGEFDWVIVDVAWEDNEDGTPYPEQTPSVPVVKLIRALVPGPKPMVVAVTGNPVAYYEDVVRRRLIEADPDVGLVWRHDLEAHVRRAVDAAALQDDLRAIPLLDAPDSIPDLGISYDTDVDRAVLESREFLADLPAGPARRDGRKTYAARDRITRAARLEPATREGLRAWSADAATIPGLRRIADRASVPEVGERATEESKRWWRRGR